MPIDAEWTERSLAWTSSDERSPNILPILFLRTSDERRVDKGLLVGPVLQD